MLPPHKKELILPGILLAGFITFFSSGAHEFFSWQVLGQYYTIIKDFVGDEQWLSYLWFFCAYLLAVTFSLPIASMLTLAGGAILGWPAATLAVIAATALATYWIPGFHVVWERDKVGIGKFIRCVWRHQRL